MSGNGSNGNGRIIVVEPNAGDVDDATNSSLPRPERRGALKRLLSASKPVKFILAGTLAVFLGGFAASSFLGERFESLRDGEAVRANIRAVEHIISDHGERLSRTEAVSAEDHDNLRWLMQQVYLTGRAVGAPVTPPPASSATSAP